MWVLKHSLLQYLSPQLGQVYIARPKHILQILYFDLVADLTIILI